MLSTPLKKKCIGQNDAAQLVFEMDAVRESQRDAAKAAERWMAKREQQYEAKAKR